MVHGKLKGDFDMIEMHDILDRAIKLYECGTEDLYGNSMISDAVSNMYKHFGLSSDIKSEIEIYDVYACIPYPCTGDQLINSHISIIYDPSSVTKNTTTSKYTALIIINANYMMSIIIDIIVTIPLGIDIDVFMYNIMRPYAKWLIETGILCNKHGCHGGDIVCKPVSPNVIYVHEPSRTRASDVIWSMYSHMLMPHMIDSLRPLYHSNKKWIEVMSDEHD